jgi:hypothetical protein
MVKKNMFYFLKQYSPIIGEKLRIFKATHDRGELGKLAKSLHIDRSRLSNFMDGKIELTPTYLYCFIRGEFITVNELLKGKDLSKMTDKEKVFWEHAKILEDAELLDIFIEEPDLIQSLKAIKRKGKSPSIVLKAAAYLTE